MDDLTIQKILKAGKVAAIVRREGALKLQKPGTSYLEVMDYCEKRIEELGAGIAWAQMAVNDVAAHFCPLEDDTAVSQEGQLIKVDIGTHVDGYIADNAMTVEVGKSHEHKDLIKAAQNALKAAVKLVEPGRTLAELGEAQMSEAQALGFTTVRNLCGHTIDHYQVHGGVSIPSFNNKEKKTIQEGWQVAIEPFVTPGDGLIKEKGQATIFMMRKNANARSPNARKIIDDMKDRNSLPFTTRWVSRKYGKGAAALGIRELLQNKVVTPYPPLAEISQSMVSQFEHSMIVGKKTTVYTRHEEDEW